MLKVEQRFILGRIQFTADELKKQIQDLDKGYTRGPKEHDLECVRAGMLLTLRENILEVLTNRFGDNGRRGGVTGKAVRLVYAIKEPKKLEAIFRRALKVKSLGPIVAMLEKAKASAPPDPWKMWKLSNW